MQQKQELPLIGYLMLAVFAPFALSLMGSFAALAFAVIGLVARAVYFLKSGYWIHSACDVTAYLSLSGFNVLDACHQFSSSWVGVDYLLNQGLGQMDASLFAFFVSAGLFIIGALGIMGFTALAEKFAHLMN
jgi:hypothetical protein